MISSRTHSRTRARAGSRTRSRALGLAAAIVLATTSMLTGAGAAGAQTGSLGSAGGSPTPPEPYVPSEVFVASPLTVTSDSGALTVSGTVENTSTDWSDCVVEVADTATVAEVEANLAALAPGEDIETIYPEDAWILGSDRVYPEGGQTAPWTLTFTDVPAEFTPGAIVWCWAGVEEGKDLFYFVDQA